MDMNIRIRSWLFTRSFRAVNKELKNVPTLALSDLFYLRVIGWKNTNIAVDFLKKFNTFRRNLHTQSWSALSLYYPRSLILWYYYQLFWWADYCEVTDGLLEKIPIIP